MAKKADPNEKWWHKKPKEKATAQRIVALDKLRKKKEEDSKKAKEKADQAKRELILGMMHSLKTQVIEHDGYVVRVSQAKPMVYDDDAIIAELTSKQRRMVTRETLDLNELPPAIRKKILESLTPTQRQAITTVTLDYEKLLEAVQAKEIDPRMVAKHSEQRENAPYISASGPKG